MVTRAPPQRIRAVRTVPMRLSPRAGSMAALLCGAMLVAMSTIATKAALADLAPLTLAFARFAIALVALIGLCLRAGVRPAFGRVPAMLGITGVTLAFVCQKLGLDRLSAMDATLVIEGSIPIATTLLGVRVLGERLSSNRVIGLALAVGGVGVVVLRGSADAGGAFSLTGGLLALGAGVSFSVYTVAGRRAFGGGVSLAVLTGSIAVGTAFLLPGVAIEAAGDGPGTFTPRAVALLLFLGLVGSALVHTLWAHGLTHLEATEVAVIGTLLPVVGVGMAALFLGEAVTITQAGGVCLVAAGLWATTRSRRRMSCRLRSSGRPRLVGGAADRAYAD